MRYRPGLLEQLAASAAGVNVEAVRQRFLRILERTAPVTVEPPTVAGGGNASVTGETHTWVVAKVVESTR